MEMDLTIFLLGRLRKVTIKKNVFNYFGKYHIRHAFQWRAGKVSLLSYLVNAEYHGIIGEIQITK